MLNPLLVVSQSLAGNNSNLSLPGPVNFTGSAYSPGGRNAFDVTQSRAFSFQAFVTGSNVVGTMWIQQSNNLVGWISVSGSGQALSGGNISQDLFFYVPVNSAGFARLMWSGSAGAGSSVTIAAAGVS